MHFEALENFEWMNDPENVRFEDDAMVIYAKEGTDFWQSIHRNFHKDSGHFFYIRQADDFILTLKWKFAEMKKFSQCGLMLRVDERNWLKVSLMNETAENNMLASSLTVAGHSDWAGFKVNDNIHEIWFRLQRVDDDYILFYSLDGLVYEKIRTAYLKGVEDVKVGAYIASPNEVGFAAQLEYIKLGL